MARPWRLRRGSTLLGAVLVVFAVGVVSVNVVEAAHRDRAYRTTTDAAFAATAGGALVESNATGVELATTLADPGALGRVVLAARLAGLEQSADAEAALAHALLAPPPDDKAAVAVADALRLRAHGVALVATTIDGLLGLTPEWPTGTALAEPAAARPVGIPGARLELERAGELFVLADHRCSGLPASFAAASDGAVLPASRWTSPSTGVLMPATLEAAAARLAHNPRLKATIRLRIAAVETTPVELPLGAGFPLPPTRAVTVAVSVVNAGSAPTIVTVVVRVTPLGSLGTTAQATAVGVVEANAAVAIGLPSLPLVPGERCVLTVTVLRPPRQVLTTGLHWRRTVSVAPD